MSVSTKLSISGVDGDARERFCKMYQERTSGKSALLHELLAAGTILKEAGLLDLVLNLDSNPEYRAAPNTLKTRMLLVELSQLFAGALPAAEAPAPVPPPAEPAAPVAEPEKAEVKEPQSAPKAAMPNFGA